MGNTVQYELMLIFSPDTGEEGVKKEVQEIHDFVSSHGGEVSFEDMHGLREMAHRIKGNDEGYYVVLNFSMPGKKLAELQKNLNIAAAVLRHLVLVLPDNYQPKTLKAYDEEAEKAEAEKQAAKKANKAGSSSRSAKPAPRKEAAKPTRTVKKDEPKEEKVEEKKAKAEEVKDEEPTKVSAAEEKKAKAEKQATLDDVDEKLRSIIDDPDITL